MLDQGRRDRDGWLRRVVMAVRVRPRNPAAALVLALVLMLCFSLLLARLLRPALIAVKPAEPVSAFAHLLARDAHTFVAEYFGRKVVVADSSMKHVQFVLSEIENERIYMLHQPDKWGRLPLSAPNATIVDIGANFGGFALAAKINFPRSHVFSFEALPPTCASLRYNMAANFGAEGGRLTVECAALGDGSPKHFVVRQGDSGGGSAHFGSFSGFGSDHEHFHNVPSYTLDQMLERHGIRMVDLLKIDCEGCEHEVLRASRRLKDVRAIVAEFHINDHLRSQGHSIEGLKEFLRSENPDILIQTKDIRMHNA